MFFSFTPGRFDFIVDINASASDVELQLEYCVPVSELAS